MRNIKQYLTKDTLFTPAVVGYAIDGNKVLLGFRKKVSLGLGLNLISGIGGKVGDEEIFKNETPEEALIREFREEVHITPLEYEKVGRVRFVWTHKPQRNQDVNIYIIRSWKEIPEETEVVKPLWFPVDGLFAKSDIENSEKIHRLRSIILDSLPKDQMWEDNLDWVPLVLLGLKVDAVFVFGEEERVIKKDVKVYEKIL